METKHKNALIGALLAVVFVMAVGYAAFAQQLTINGSASISSSWDVHIKDIQGQVTNSQPLEIIPQTQEILHMIQQQLILQLN